MNTYPPLLRMTHRAALSWPNIRKYLHLGVCMGVCGWYTHLIITSNPGGAGRMCL